MHIIRLIILVCLDICMSDFGLKNIRDRFRLQLGRLCFETSQFRSLSVLYKNLQIM